jgi:hypothetical protein
LNSALDTNRNRFPIWIGPLLIGLLAAAALFITTRWGLGFSTDSVRYLRIAEWMLGRESGSFSSHFPPGYSGAIALAGLIDPEPRNGARWIALIVFAANVTVLGTLAGVMAGRSRFWAAACALFFALTAPVVNVHIMAWSEGPFILCAFAGLWLLARSCTTDSESSRWQFLIAGAIFIGFSVLMRWMGASVVLAGSALIMTMNGSSLLRRGMRAFTMSAVAMAPVFAWMIFAKSISDSSTGRNLGMYLLGTGHLLEVWDTISGWLTPAQLRDSLFGRAPNEWVARITALICIVILGVCWRIARRAAKASPQVQSPVMLRALGTFIVSYLCVLLLSIAFADPFTPLDDRILTPVYVAITLAFPYLLIRFMSLSGAMTRGRGVVRTLVITVCTIALISTSLRGIEIYRFSYASGFGFSGQRWRESELIKVVRSLPRYTPIYTNFPDAVYFRTGKTPRVLPFPPVQGLDDEQRFIDRNAAVRRDIRDSGAVVLLFKGGVRSRLAQREVSPQQARAWWGVGQLDASSIRRFRDGRLMMAVDVASRSRREVLDALSDFAPTPQNQPPEDAPIPEDR